MAGEQDNSAQPSDAAMLESAFAETPAAAEPPPQEAEPPPADKGDGGPARDDAGRFAAKAKAETDVAGIEAGKVTKGGDGEDRDGGQIPSWRLRELREERDRIAAQAEIDRRELETLKRERAQFIQRQRQQREAQEAPQRPDPIADPDAYAEYMDNVLDTRVKSLDEQFRDRWVNLTFAEEHEKHGEAFDKAMAALEKVRSPQLVAEIREAVNPGKALMRWHRQQTTRAEVGDDLDGFLKRKQDEWAKDPEVRKRIMAELDAEARGDTGNRSTVISIPSLNRATGGGGGASRPGTLPQNDRDFFNDATAGLRR